MAFADSSAVVRDVMRYFLQHPAAADTLEGIARWRLAAIQVQDVVDETNVALKDLVDRGILGEIRVSGAPTLFRLNPSRTADARELLEGES